MWKQVRLDPRLSRGDLTDRECAKIMGGLIGALCDQSEVETVRRAIIWWSQNQSAWETFRKMKRFYSENPDVDVAKTIPLDDSPPKVGKF